MSPLKYVFPFTIILVPLISAQCNYKTATPFFKRAVYEFTLKLSKRLNLETDNHFVSSALSLWTLLSTVSLGAVDPTYTEIQEVLRLHPHKCFNNLYFELAKQISQRPANPTAALLERSSTIFFDDTLNVKESFIDEVRSVGLCDARVVSFFDTTVTSSIINKFISVATNETIDKIVTPNDLDGTLMVLIDALYFKGTWKVAFPYENTKSGAFYNDKGEKVGDASLMYVSGTFNVTYLPQIQANVLELPYGDGSRYSMLIFLPNPNVSLATMIDYLDRITLTSVYYLFRAQGAQTVDVEIPKFKLSTDIYNMKEFLIDMGLKSMFNPNVASFPGITDYMISMSDLIQKVDVEVTEDGTVASTVTAALFQWRMLPLQFVANRPFLFMIADRDLEVPIFTGAYSKPSFF